MYTKEHIIKVLQFAKKYISSLYQVTIILGVILGLVVAICFISNGEAKTLADGVALLLFSVIGCTVISVVLFLTTALISGIAFYICHGILRDALIMIAGLSFLQFIYFLMCILTVFLCHEVYKSGIYLSKGFLIAISVMAMINVMFMFHKNHRKNQ